MKKHFTLVLGILFLSIGVQGQQQVKLYLTSDWKVTNQENAAYFRDCHYDTDRFLLDGEVHDYIISGELFMVGNYIKGKRDGEFTFYYPNGKVESKGIYNNNIKLGQWHYYYSSGQLKQVINYAERNPDAFKMYTPFFVIEYYDSQGKPLLQDGTGVWVNDSIRGSMYDTESLCTLKGKFKNGKMHGKWRLVRISDKKLLHQENFRNGKFQSASIYDDKSRVYATTSAEILIKNPDKHHTNLWNAEKFEFDTTVFPPNLLLSDVETVFSEVTGSEYKIQNRAAGYAKGDLYLLQFIAENIRYPQHEIESDVSGRVFVGVSIDERGQVEDIRVVRGIGKSFDAEALRVVGLLTDWLPAIQEGKPVKATITIPVNFQLLY